MANISATDHIRCNIDGDIIEAAVKDEVNGSLICTVLYPSKKYKQGDTFTCDPNIHDVKKLTMGNKIDSYVQGVLGKSSQSLLVDTSPYTNRFKCAHIDVRETLKKKSNKILEEDFIKVCGLFLSKYDRESQTSYWNPIQEKKCWRFLLNSLKSIEKYHNIEKVAIEISDEHIEEDLNKFKEIDEDANKIKENIDKLQSDDKKVTISWTDTSHFRVSKKKIASKVCPECGGSGRSIIDDGICSWCGGSGEDQYPSSKKSAEEYNHARTKEEFMQIKSKKTNEPFDKHKSQYKFDEKEGIIYKDERNIEKISQIRKLLAGVDDIKGKEVIYDGKNYEVIDYLLDDGVFTYTVKNKQTGKEIPGVKGGELTFLKAKSHKLPQEEFLFLKQSFEVLQTALDHYVKEDDPSYLEQIIGRCDLIQNECRKAIEQHNSNGS